MFGGEAFRGIGVLMVFGLFGIAAAVYFLVKIVLWIVNHVQIV